MKNIKCCLGLILIAIFCVSYVQSTRCYYCSSKEECENPKFYECTTRIANDSRSYLDIHHENTPMDVISKDFECFREVIKIDDETEFHYKSCIYSNIRVCDLRLRELPTSNSVTQECYQCKYRNGCNPAGHAVLNLSAVFVPTIILAIIAKYIWIN